MHELATKANTTLSDMPECPNRNIHRMEDVLVKIVDLENEINEDIDSYKVFMYFCRYQYDKIDKRADMWNAV